MAQAMPYFCFWELQVLLDRVNEQVLATTDQDEKQIMRVTKKRLQDRLYQRKHRAKREYKILMLEHVNQTLQTDIACLYQNLQCNQQKKSPAYANDENQRRQQPLHPDESLKNHAELVVLQFFRVYHDGYSLSLSGYQERFLRSILAADVVGVDLRGADAFIQQWRLYDQYFELYVLEPQIWKTHPVGDEGVMVEVELMLYLRCHRQSISSLFSSVKTGRVDFEHVRLLITGTTAVAGTYTFVFNRSGYVSNLLVCLQLLDTLRRLLGSLQNVVELTDGGRIALSSGTITVG
ncbi:hypothetical protein Plhal304r1_c022g0076861 [Plasmopara halstedii]